ncbi:uncharacterized protein [Anolis sagrei]|uniref:uncharacterized protein n=1 Tax=Anolis sagrei TaxID=38937 RepID=UPI0035206355
MHLSLLFHFCLLLIGNEAKQFYKCALAKILKEEGMDGYGGYSLGDWLCVIYYTSDFDTQFKEKSMSVINRFGVFQIDSNEFCEEDCVESKNKCSVHCSNFLDNDIKDDIACAKLIVDSHHDIQYWPEPVVLQPANVSREAPLLPRDTVVSREKRHFSRDLPEKNESGLRRRAFYAGSVVNLEKSHLEPTHRIQFIGAVLDSMAEGAFLPNNRFCALQILLHQTLHNAKISARQTTLTPCSPFCKGSGNPSYGG